MNVKFSGTKVLLIFILLSSPLENLELHESPQIR